MSFSVPFQKSLPVSFSALLLPGNAAFGFRSRREFPEIIGRVGMSFGHKVLRSAFEDHLSAIVSGFGADVDDPVRRTDDIQVMFHDDHGVATGQ